MVFYSKDEKILIIPEGLGNVGSDCEERYREGYREGYRDGLDDCDCSGSTDCSSAITEAYQNGYADGLNDCSGSSCNLEDKTLEILDGWGESETVYPSEGYDGLSSVSVIDMGYGQGKYDEGYAAGLDANCGEAIEEAYESGQTAGAAAQKALLTSTAITENGTYTRENGWNSISVNVATGCNMQTKIFQVTNKAMENVFPDNGYDGMSQVMLLTSNLWNSAYTEGYADGQADCPECDCSSAVTEAYQEGYEAGLNDCSGSSCNLETGTASLGSNWDGDDTITPPQGYDGFDSIRIVDNGYGQSKYDEGYAAGLNDCSGDTPCDCSEAYESGLTGGYIDSTKLAYFNQPAWVEIGDPQYFEVGDVLDMTFVTGESGGTLHLLGNLNSGYTELEYDGGPGIAIDYLNEGGLRISMFDSEGLRHIWNPFSSVRPVICRNSGDTYHLILKTSNAYWESYERIYMQVTLINESRFNDVYSASATGETIHFSSGATSPFVINGVYDEDMDVYGEMNSELKIKSLKVYKPEAINNPVIGRPNSNLVWKDGKLFDTAVGGEIDAYIYEQGMKTTYYLPSADDELYLLW